MKKLSIIIVNYHSWEYLEKCLQSILADKEDGFLHDMEIFIIDNAFQEKIPDMQKITSKTAITIVKNKNNLGFAKANNQGIKKSKGQYVLLLNPDTLVSPKTLQTMVKFMDENPKTGVAGCRVSLPTGKMDDASHRGFPTPWNAFCYFAGLANLFPKSQFFNGYHLGYRQMDKIHEIDACAGAFMMIRRRAGEETGWLDEDYFWYGEDLDFCYRLKQKKWKIMYVPQVGVIHFKGVSSGIKKHSESLSKADEATKKQAQKARFAAMRIFYKKHYRKKYPPLMTGLILAGIRFKELMTKI